MQVNILPKDYDDDNDGDDKNDGCIENKDDEDGDDHDKDVNDNG